jgi:putative transcriptional regulator
MKTEDFESLKRGLEQAAAFARGENVPGIVVHHAVDVKSIREATGLSQAKFASAYQIPLGTIKDWEQGRRIPDAPARALLKVIAADPKKTAAALAA